MRAPRLKRPVSEAQGGEMYAALLAKQKSGLYAMRFHVEVALAQARTTKPRKTISSHLRIALRSIEVDYKEVLKKEKKLRGP